MRTIGTLVVAGCLVAATVTTAEGASSASAPIAAALVSELQARHVDAIAAADPSQPGRYVAALLVPGQLLVVSAMSPSGGALAQRIASGAYRDVYLDLQGTPTPTGKFFVQDAGADGIQDGHDGIVDVVYEDGTRQILFDRTLAKAVKGAAYDRALSAADARYERALMALLDAVRAHPADPGAAQTGATQ
jgi:hypothetical protein